MEQLTITTEKKVKHTFNINDAESCVDTYTSFEKDIFNGSQLAYKVSANLHMVY